MSSQEDVISFKLSDFLGTEKTYDEVSSNSLGEISVIDSKGHKYQIKLNQCKELASTLTPYYNVKIDDLEGAALTNYQILSHIAEYIQGSPEADAFFRELGSVFEPFKDKIAPQTVGAYFYGCNSRKCGAVPQGCNIYCAGSIRSSHQKECGYSVYLIEGNELTKLSTGARHPRKAYLHLTRGDTIKNNHINQLREDGIVSVMIVKNNNDGSCQYLEDKFVSLEQLRNLPSSTSYRHQEVNDWSVVFLVIIIVIVILLVAVGYWLFQRNRNSYDEDIYERNFVTNFWKHEFHY